MGLLNIILIGVGLAMDAVAVTIAKSICHSDFSITDNLKMALCFGLFQAGMPLLGWLLGIRFESYITSYDHWIAFILLLIIGGKMIWEGMEIKDEDCDQKLDMKTILVLGVATSIDALAVGVSFAFLSVEISTAVILIGITTFVLCLIAGRLGATLGSLVERRANLVGGLILIGIGTKILLEHTILK